MAASKECRYAYVLLLYLTVATYLIQGMAIELGSEDRLSNKLCRTPLKCKAKLRDYWRPRRMLIGSIAPTCTYNECRGCKYKCRAEQVPVDGNDPVNSAYHYKCVCHRQ